MNEYIAPAPGNMKALKGQLHGVEICVTHGVSIDGKRHVFELIPEDGNPRSATEEEIRAVGLNPKLYSPAAGVQQIPLVRG